jgi:hypothetical protein
LDAEVTNISPHGLWLLLDGQEVFVSFRDFPWFADATVQQLIQVRRPSPHHLYWPALDVDLAVESLHHPDQFPMVSRVDATKRPPRSRADEAAQKAQRQRARSRT